MTSIWLILFVLIWILIMYMCWRCQLFANTLKDLQYRIYVIQKDTDDVTAFVKSWYENTELKGGKSVSENSNNNTLEKE